MDILKTIALVVWIVVGLITIGTSIYYMVANRRWMNQINNIDKVEEA